MLKDNKTIKLNGNSLSIKDVVAVARSGARVILSDEAKKNIKKSRIWVEKAVLENKVMYGITTGFGAFKTIAINEDQTSELQLNLIRSHASGVGEAFPLDICRAIMLLRINSLAKGYSGVRLLVVEKLIELLNKNVYPYIPSQGSVGSSGDLAPLCHMALVLLGEGECWQDGKRVPSIQVLKNKNIKPITLSSKEGLGLSNGTNVQTAVLSLATYDAGILIQSADIIASLSVEVLMGSNIPFREQISRVREQLGQIKCAKNIWNILKDSPLIKSHKDCDRVQDAYSLRCIPQVHGAVRDTYDHVVSVVVRELNAATDNPLIFVDDDKFFSGGNFHGEPIAIVSDMLKIAICELGNISERRIAKMVDSANNEGLPAFLVDKKLGGLHSGLMIPQYTAASLVSENKVLAHPASVDSIPTSANQEDHVSMGTIAARQVAMIVENVRNVLAIELLNNTQAYEFRKGIAKLSKVTGKLYNEVRKIVPVIFADRAFYKDIALLAEMIQSESVVDVNR
jgi:histidine ammonia-lyase